jgi:hypothetical protein
MFSFQNDQSMGRPVVTKGVPSSAWHGILSNMPSHAASTAVTPAWSLATTGSCNQAGLHAQCPELLCAKTTISALQLEVHLPVADRAPQQCPRWFSHAWGGCWTNLLHLSTECYVKWAHLVCQCHSHSQDCVPRGRLSLKTEEISASSGTDATDHHEVTLRTLSWDTINYRVISPRLSFHDCCFDIFIGWCLYSPWVTRIQVCCRCDMAMLLPSSKHISAYYHLHDVHLNDTA